MKKRFGDLKKTASFAADHLKRPAILVTLTVLEILPYPPYTLSRWFPMNFRDRAVLIQFVLFLRDCGKRS